MSSKHLVCRHGRETGATSCRPSVNAADGRAHDGLVCVGPLCPLTHGRVAFLSLVYCTKQSRELRTWLHGGFVWGE